VIERCLGGDWRGPPCEDVLEGGAQTLPGPVDALWEAGAEFVNVEELDQRTRPRNE
jgi:hypothetical protein